MSANNNDCGAGEQRMFDSRATAHNAPIKQQFELLPTIALPKFRQKRTDSANDAVFCTSLQSLEKQFATLQARLAIRGHQLKRENFAPRGADWYYHLDAHGRSSMFLCLRDVVKFVDRLDDGATAQYCVDIS